MNWNESPKSLIVLSTADSMERDGLPLYMSAAFLMSTTSQLSDHLARPHLLRLFAHGWTTLFIPNPFVKNLPDQTTQPVGDRANSLGVPSRIV